MTKSQLKERSLLLASFAMIQEGFRLLELDPMKVDLSKFKDTYDIKFIMLYKKMFKLNKIFTNKKISKFLDKRLSKIDDTLEHNCQPLYIGLLVLYFYKKTNIKKDLVIVEMSDEDIKFVIKEYSKEFEITNCTVNKAIDIFKAIYPDKEGYIEYLKITNKFPYDIIIKNNKGNINGNS